MKVYINSTALFMRLAAVAKREENKESYFYYKITNEQMSLFKNMMMCKPDKPSLWKALVTDEESHKLTSSQNNYSVMDGGALLHRMCCIKESNLKKIAKNYVQYVRKHYGKCF